MSDSRSEEFILIIDFGDVYTRLLFAHFSEEGEIDLVDALSVPSKGVKHRIPDSVSEAGGVLRELILKIEEKYELSIQTLFCLLKGETVNLHGVKNCEPYRKFLKNMATSNSAGPASLPAGEIPPHEELVDVFGDEHSAARVALSIDASPREKMQKAILEADCFLEGFVASPRSMCGQAASQMRLWIDFFEEGTLACVVSDEALLFYKFDGFSMNSLVDHFVDCFSVSAELIRDVLELEMRPTASQLNDWEEKVEAQVFLTENLSIIKDDIATKLERYVMTLRAQLEAAGLFEELGPEFTLSGCGAPLFKKYVFLRDILPFRSQTMDLSFIKNELFQDLKKDYADLYSLLPYVYEMRSRHREKLQKHSKINRLREWSRRLLGR